MLICAFCGLDPAAGAGAAAPEAGSGAGTGGSSSSSNASNYNDGQLSVNSRTGAASFQVDLVQIPGITDDIDLTVSLSYRAEDALSNAETDTRYFGLPYGWWLNISFIDNLSTYRNLHADGSQTYPLNPDWRSLFTLPGGTPSMPLTTSLKTGLQQYNRADTNFRDDLPSITVGGISSQYALTNLGGVTEYFSENGLLLEKANRFGDSIQYLYDRDTNARSARFQSIVDSWGHTTTFDYCEDETCTPGQVTVTLPDGRTVGWIAPNATTLTDVIDAEGKRTHLSWETSPCEHGRSVLSGLTSPSGAMTSLTYQCLQVCTQPSKTSCLTDGNVTTWPVVKTLYECPNNTSGTKCPGGSASDYLTTRYAFDLPTNSRNYTGYPQYSPYVPADPADPQADSLMQSNDSAFRYTTQTSKLSSGGTEITRQETDYNFLHLQTEDRTYVRARQSNGSFGLTLSKEKSYCYFLSPGSTDCSLKGGSYQDLAANYQSPTIVGSCVYNLDGGDARRSVVTMTYDSFGNQVNKKTFHGTRTEGIVSSCDRSTRLSTSGMRLVMDDYMQYDTPSSVSSDGFLELGAAGTHFGLLTGQMTFLYLDEDDSGVGAHEPLASTTGPILVRLACNELTTGSGDEKAGASIKRGTIGLLSNDAAAPAMPGVIDACANPPWDATVAPPKTTTFSYDAHGRALSRKIAWADGFTGPGGVDSTSGTMSYTMTGAEAGEEACGDAGAANVQQIEATDATGNETVNRLCTLNGFHLSRIDAAGRRRLNEHSPTGLTTNVTNPNGTFVSTDYYYACPLAQDGHSKTCAGSTQTDCPFDDAAQKRSCTIETNHAGTDPHGGAANSSYADGVAKIEIKDGLGRTVAMRDNLGASSSGYTEPETRSETVYDSLGLVTSRNVRIGTSDPLIYRSTTTYGPKLRASMVCGARGDAEQYVHDDVAQTRMVLSNGIPREAYTLNDSQQLTSIANCQVVPGSPTASGGCPTTADSPTSTTCPADAYFTYVLHDGAGQIHSVTASMGQTMSPGTSVTSVHGVSTYSADMMKYGFTYSGQSDGHDVSGSSSWKRDLLGQMLQRDTTLNANGSTSTRSTDAYTYNQIAEKTGEQNKLGASLQESYAYSPTGTLTRNTSYEGVDFHHYYDDLDREIRFCYAADGGGSQGESFVLDPITGSPLTIVHFTNPAACSDCGAAICDGDQPGEAIHYSYTRFNKLRSIVYADGSGAELQWAYDPYQRVTCFADAFATSHGGGCPDSPTDNDFNPDPGSFLVSYRYWPDNDPYRRGFAKSQCRGVLDTNGTPVTRCVDTDYYTAAGTGGSCASGLSGVVGAFAGQVKQEMYCSGGSCLDGSGTLLHQTTYLYDEHRRPCSVETRDAAGKLIRGTAFTYDQFDQIVSETHTSDLDPSDESNYRVENVYDGLMRLVGQTRTDAEGNLIEKLGYEYDAANNLIKKVRQAPAVSQPGPEPTPTPTGAATAQPVTPTATATAKPTQSGGEDDGCQVQPAAGAPWPLLVVALLPILGRRRRREHRRSRSRAV